MKMRNEDAGTGPNIEENNTTDACPDLFKRVINA